MNKSEFVENLESFKSFLVNNHGVVEGCNEQQIESIEKLYNIALPEFYKVYLRYFGIESGSYLKGTRAFFKDIVAPHSITTGMLELLHENNIFPPNDLFAIALHQGYVGLFFILNDSASDPLVYSYQEGDQIKELKRFSLLKVESFKQYMS